MVGPSDDRPADRLSGTGVHRVSLPAANEMGRVNAWLVDDDPLTLVDSGIGAPGAIEAIEAAFVAIGRRLEDLELLVLTHQHTDHLGLAGELARRSGAEVAALAPLVPYLADLPAELAADRAFMAELLRRHGATPAEVTGNDAGWSAFHAGGGPCTVTVPLLPGSAVTLRDRTLEVLSRPGHSETDVLLVDADRRTAFGGDHLLRTTASVPVRDRPLPAGEGTRPYDPVVDDLAVTLRYAASLRATRTVPLDLVLPGHGGPFGDPAAVADAHLVRQAEAAARLLGRTGDGPFTAMGLARSVWPDAPAGRAQVLVSTVLGGLGVLREQGRVEVADAGGDGRPMRFVTT
ncbi:MBL fold metallo-hydrolase [Patulibacter sp.]|uniref:MBL fold metallo-hydrolase n=1 Tax=Patulibacter sp. TaxID=1912859 RepID=UPI00272613CA|nr:MBL fold metallo-hydrolase [Patulibacter sp.]MDO9409741.1 MBL fold metallo-hydrolase [Patulibacter sp.]